MYIAYPALKQHNCIPTTSPFSAIPSFVHALLHSLLSSLTKLLIHSHFYSLTNLITCSFIFPFFSFLFQELQDISDSLKFKHGIGPTKAKIKYRRIFKCKKQSAFRRKWKDELERLNYVNCCQQGRCWEKFQHEDLQVPYIFIFIFL